MNSIVNSIASTSVVGPIKLVYSFHGVGFSSDEIIPYINEGLEIIGMHSRDLALHCIRVSRYSIAIGKRLGISDSEIELLWCAAILHDVGKRFIPLGILDKPEKLTMEEYNIIKTHSYKGCEYVRKNNKLKEVADIILYHHERYDGSGYPSAKEAWSIPLLSRIISVADAFDAMISERPYRMALSVESALAELKNGKWSQFDGAIVDHIIDLVECKGIQSKAMNIDLSFY